MPFYYPLYREAPEVASRAAAGLLRLREQMALEGIPARTHDRTLLLATWNIREFDSAKYGGRTPEAIYYIAEIISHFDLVAVQEVRQDLRALERLLDILGSSWRYLTTDVTEGRSGNGERLAFLYDSRKVVFRGLAGEVVLPDSPSERVLQFARTPFVCGFRASWVKFDLCTVHIYYGDDDAEDPRRVGEIRSLARLLAKRAKPRAPRRGGSATPASPHLLLLGDFNIFGRQDSTMRAITDAGFEVPAELQSIPGSNVARNKHYDQIALFPRAGRFATTGRAGALDYYQSVFRLGQDEGVYADALGRSRSFKDWRTYQMSDHLPMWVELKIDFGMEYLTEMAGAEG